MTPWIKYCNHGITRLVLLIGNWAIKVPNFEYEHRHFLLGCYTNWQERDYTKVWNSYPPMGKMIAPTVWCSWFGLVSIQKRVLPLGRGLTEEEKKSFEDICSDIKPDNFG